MSIQQMTLAARETIGQTPRGLLAVSVEKGKYRIEFVRRGGHRVDVETIAGPFEATDAIDYLADIVAGHIDV